MGQTRIYKTRSPVHSPTRVMRSNEERERDRAVEKSVAAEEIKAELDDILDEIDDVLEENAEEFVDNYVQYGGE
jgi:ubiquitin-like protein Pup